MRVCMGGAVVRPRQQPRRQRPMRSWPSCASRWSSRRGRSRRGRRWLSRRPPRGRLHSPRPLHSPPGIDRALPLPPPCAAPRERMRASIGRTCGPLVRARARGCRYLCSACCSVALRRRAWLASPLCVRGDSVPVGPGGLGGERAGGGEHAPLHGREGGSPPAPRNAPSGLREWVGRAYFAEYEGLGCECVLLGRG